MTLKKMGWRPSSGDLGIQKFTVSNTVKMLGASTPTDQYIITENVPVFDQLQLDSCVANATCGMLEVLMGLQNPASVVALSRLFVYWNARFAIDETKEDKGSFIHDALNSLVNKGVCLESTWPYEESKVFTQPNIEAFKQGDDNTLNSFSHIQSSGANRLADIEAAVRANHPVVFGTEVGAELQHYDGNLDTVFNYPTTSIGGHAMLVVGVRRNPDLQFYIRNSWGPNWGMKGHFWMSADYMTNSSTSDIFVGTMMPNLLT